MAQQRKGQKVTLLCRFLNYLQGPRHVDLPIRIALLLIGIASMVPDALAVESSLYLVFYNFTAFLIVAAGFFPLTVSITTFVLHVAFAFIFPDFLNPFQIVGVVAAAVVLSHERWRWFLGICAAFLIAGLALPGTGEEPVTLLFLWTFGAMLGVGAAFFEKRIQAEVAQREENARRTQQAVERMRIQLAIDTHDTVSHGLAAEAAIIRILNAEARITERQDARLPQLALVNAHTQQQLRLLLARLTDDQADPVRKGNFEADIQRAAETIRAATEAGGYKLNIQMGHLPQQVSQHVVETALFILKELATNIVKHASDPTDCHIFVTSTIDNNTHWLKFTSRNPSEPFEGPTTPRSLGLRMARANGACRATYGDGLCVVEVTMPVTVESE